MNQITASAISFTVAGNSGISSFLTLFLLGCIEKYDDSLLAMSDGMESILSSWVSLVFLGILTILEFIAMCVPVVDEITDTVMTAVIPIISLVATLGTLGLYDSSSSSSNSDEGSGRELLGDGSAVLGAWKFFVVAMGIGLAITMHLFKMLVRLIGEGWLTNVLTVLETTWCTVTLFVAIFIRTVAIFIAAMIVGAAVWVWIRRYRRTHAEKEAEEAKRKTQLEAAKQQAAAQTAGGGDEGLATVATSSDTNFVSMP